MKVLQTADCTYCFMIYTQGEIALYIYKNIYKVLSDTLHSSGNTSVGTYCDSIMVWRNSKTVVKSFCKGQSIANFE